MASNDCNMPPPAQIPQKPISSGSSNGPSNGTKRRMMSGPSSPLMSTMDKMEKCLQSFTSLLGTESLAASANDGPVNNNINMSLFPNQSSSSAVTMGGILAAQSNTANELTRYLLDDPDHPVGGAVCQFPSLNLYSGSVKELPLPSVGSSAGLAKPGDNNTVNAARYMASSQIRHNENGAPPAPPQRSPEVKIPAMTASVFDRLAAKKRAETTALPSMPQPTSAAHLEEAASANANATMIEQAAARNLGKFITWTRSSVHLAPMTMLRNLATSFSSLVDSRVRAWTLLLLRHSVSSGDDTSRSRLLSLLATSHAIDLTVAVTTFQALARPNIEFDGNPNELILPVIFEAVIDVGVQGQQLVVKLRAPGTITGKFTRDREPIIEHAKIQLDTNTLVASMVEQARLVVFKAVAKSATNQSSGSHPAKPGNDQSLSQITSALNLSKYNAQENQDKDNFKTPPQKTPQIPRQSESTSDFSKTRKNRSVTWNHPIENTYEKTQNSWNDSNKRRKLVSQSITGVSTLKSSKSFGKPDANTFESKRNATFAEFGQTHKNQHVKTYVNDGQFGLTTTRTMARFDKKPMQDNQISRKNAIFSAASLSLTGNRNKNAFTGCKNALFGGLSLNKDGANKRFSSSLRPSGSRNGLQRMGSTSDMSSGLKPTMTALELLLLPHKKKY